MVVVHVFSTWLKILATTLAVVAGIWLVAEWAGHLRLLDVQTGSMVPTFRPADALVVRRVQGVPEVGQIVSYHSSRNPNELVTHRVIAVRGNMFQTKGDALSSFDPPVRNNLLVGRVVMIMPGLSHALRWLRSLPGLIITVYVPALAVALYELRRLEGYYKRLRPYYLRPR